MDWFEKLTGFKEGSYKTTKERFSIEGRRLVSDANGKSFQIGELGLPSLSELRAKTFDVAPCTQAPSLSIIRGDVRQLHARPEFAGALFQVASQFNALEMVGPSVTPEDGVTRYQDDHTQGPSCAIAAGAATIYRNYLAPIGSSFGQTKVSQLDTLYDLREMLASKLGRCPADLWTMRNGYLECRQESLRLVCDHIAAASEADFDQLRGLVRIAVHSEVEVTFGSLPGPIVSQAFCSALPISYSGIPPHSWRPFASLILEAAYEATLLAGALNAVLTGSPIVLLTMLGGGAFGNEEALIIRAMFRAIKAVRPHALDVRIVSYAEPSRELVKAAQSFR